MIVTIGPDEGLAGRIGVLLPQIRCLAIVNNGAGPGALDAVFALPEAGKITVITNSCNIGQPAALNQGLGWAEANGYAWALILDDDTEPHDDLVDGLIHAQRALLDGVPLAAVGAAYSHRVPTMRQAKEREEAAAREVTAIQASGALVSLRAWRAVGCFDETLFITLVDYEFCLRARALGFRIAMTTRRLMTHAIGSPRRHRFLWRHVHTFNPDPLRVYFGFRNFSWVARGYLRREPLFILREARNMAKALAYVVLYEDQKMGKLRAAVRGIRDGLRRRVGCARWPE